MRERDRPADETALASPALALAAARRASWRALSGGAWYIFVRQGEEETYLELQGNIDVRQVNLSFKVDGRIETLAVDEGDTVKAGQVVATLDKRYFEDELRVARASEIISRRLWRGSNTARGRRRSPRRGPRPPRREATLT